MIERIIALFKTEFGTIASIVAFLVFMKAMLVCACKRRWPEIGPVVVMLLSAAGVVSGIKIAVLTLFLPVAQLGPLADDKPALLIGGLATFVLSLREATSNWRKTTGF